MAKGRIFIDIERCKGCEICYTACPQDVIAFAEQLNSKGYRPAVYVDPNHDCTGCALCAVVCPDGCITVFKEISPQSSRQMRPKEVQLDAEAVA